VGHRGGAGQLNKGLFRRVLDSSYPEPDKSISAIRETLWKISSSRYYNIDHNVLQNKVYNWLEKRWKSPILNIAKLATGDFKSSHLHCNTIIILFLRHTCDHMLHHYHNIIWLRRRACESSDFPLCVFWIANNLGTSNATLHHVIYILAFLVGCGKIFASDEFSF
jgi:hypothetical protein